jgi:hypothetical protein
MMLLRSKTIVLGICLFLIAFKVAASCIFIEAALERAHQTMAWGLSTETQHGHDSRESADDKHHHVSSLNLMSHITAYISEINNTLILSAFVQRKFIFENDDLRTQNFPDSAFKPPKAGA